MTKKKIIIWESSIVRIEWYIELIILVANYIIKEYKKLSVLPKNVYLCAFIKHFRESSSSDYVQMEATAPKKLKFEEKTVQHLSNETDNQVCFKKAKLGNSVKKRSIRKRSNVEWKNRMLFKETSVVKNLLATQHLKSLQ